jgi:hypothetical protein
MTRKLKSTSKGDNRCEGAPSGAGSVATGGTLKGRGQPLTVPDYRIIWKITRSG